MFNPNKKKLASFYTPRDLAQVLTDWAIMDSHSTVLDPSFGGCAFLYAALESLKKKGNKTPGAQVYGVDIDPDAKNYLKPLFESSANPDQFVISDFFNVTPAGLKQDLFDAVVGNPPYIRYHNISDEAEIRAAKCLNEYDIKISGRASYWAYFLLYSMQFLKRGGRLAMILPGALLHTDYSEKVRDLLKGFFRDVTIFLLEDRVFDSTQEESVLVFADGAQEPHQRLRVGAVSKISDLPKALINGHATTKIITHSKVDGEWLRALLESEVLSIYDEIAESDGFVRLGELVNIRIGVVTGNNNFFILSDDERKKLRIAKKYTIPIVRRPAKLKGLSVTDSDLNTIDTKQRNRLLAIKPDQAIDDHLREFFFAGEKLGISQATKCRDRKPWFSVPETFVPHAFVPCMFASWPRLVINKSTYTCTNNILRLIWKEPKLCEDWLKLAVGTLSTFSQLSAELVGRSYGGGVLKLEPKELARLVVPLVDADIAMLISPKLDSLLRDGKLMEATQLVDATLVEAQIGLTAYSISKLRIARDFLFIRRRHHRKDVEKILG
jgi:adenine-specific DNA methylase